MNTRTLSLAFCAMLIAACTPAAAPSTATPVPTVAPPPAPTLAPTATRPAPTPTPAPATAVPPSATPPPTAMPTATQVPKSTKPLNLVASSVIVADAISNLTAGIEGIRVSSVVPVGADPHEYEPTAADAKKLSEASAFFVIGVNFEDEWLEKVAKSLPAGVKTVAGDAGIKINKIDRAFDSEHDTDPHYWMDPLRWQQAVNTYAKSIAALDPAIAGAVSANATRYSERLTQLDAEIRQEAAKVAPEMRLLATTHDAMGYWAERYDYKVVATIIPGPSTTAGAVNPRNIKAVVDKLRAAKVKALFAEEGINPKLTEAVAKEAGITVVETLYLDTLSGASGPAATYIDLMRHNARTIVGALK